MRETKRRLRREDVRWKWHWKQRHFVTRSVWQNGPTGLHAQPAVVEGSKEETENTSYLADASKKSAHFFSRYGVIIIDNYCSTRCEIGVNNFSEKDTVIDFRFWTWHSDWPPCTSGEKDLQSCLVFLCCRNLNGFTCRHRTEEVAPCNMACANGGWPANGGGSCTCRRGFNGQCCDNGKADTSTIGDFEANNDTYCLQKRIEKFH